MLVLSAILFSLGPRPIKWSATVTVGLPIPVGSLGNTFTRHACGVSPSDSKSRHADSEDEPSQVFALSNSTWL